MNRLAVVIAVAVLLVAAAGSAATVSGTVRDSATGAALPGINIDVYSATGSRVTGAITSASGGYTVTLPAGSYRFLAWDGQGRYATSFHADAESFDTSTVVALTASQSASILFSLHRAGSISGTVAGGGAPLGNATVVAYNESGTTRGWTRTDASGAYRLILPPGTYRVAAWDDTLTFLPRFSGGAKTFVLAAGVPVTAALDARVDFALPPASVLSGIVLDAVTRTPLAGMVVDFWTVEGTYAGWAQTAADGTYRAALEAGSYRLVFSDPAGAYAPAYPSAATSLVASPAVAVGPGETRGALDAALVRGGRISGRITDARNGAALQGISVAAWNEDGTARTIVRTDASGMYTLVVPPGAFRIGAWDEALRYAPRFRFDTSTFAQAATLTVFAGDAHGAVDLTLWPRGTTRRRSVGR